MKETDPRMHSAEHLLTGVLAATFGMGRPFTTTSVAWPVSMTRR